MQVMFSTDGVGFPEAFYLGLWNQKIYVFPIWLVHTHTYTYECVYLVCVLSLGIQKGDTKITKITKMENDSYDLNGSNG